MLTITALGALLVAVSGTADVGPKAEPWADPKLPVTRGLTLWLDASRLSQARQAVRRPTLQAAEAVDVWPDGSGWKRDVAQPAADARPKYHPAGDFHAVRFDGRDDHLLATGLKLSARDVTVFLVAAPHSCPEWFSAFLSASAEGRNDFQTGLNIDQAVGGPQRFEVVNVEGAGSQGLKNLLKSPVPYGTVMRLCVTSAPGQGGVALWANGKLQDRRDRAAGTTVHMDRLVVGARYFNIGAAPQVRCSLDGDLAEVLVFDRLLADDERAAVEKYLAEKYGAVPRLSPPHGPGAGVPLARVESPPPVQMFLPGFTVRELPLDLVNVNNVLYRPDGALVTLGYDGVVRLLRDTDGDGLEDRADVFWDGRGSLRSPIGMDLTPPGHPLGDGVFVAAKGKCVLILDADRDGKADKEVVVADGWKELPHGVDALGVAVAKDGSVYFGLGCTNFTDAYLVGKDGKARYDLKGERGTILRVAPDFKSRKVVATGIRFPVGLRFHREGDLFCTDQEGATWLPNGNPFDELLHIQEGRHYGFPPRHPRHLPNVIDEPSTFDYAPQHQSTCGLNFNEPVAPGGPTFGPRAWAGDVLVAGYSRGKLYRTQLKKTPDGYIARSHLLASLNMLPADLCVAPNGALVVACHSGGPDWGSGATGKGKLYKVGYADPGHPQPVFAWAAGPAEVRVEFDRPVAPALLRNLVRRTTLTAGKYVRAGDRFESLWPGYATVQSQKRTPRFDVPVRSAQLTADRRTLVLATDPHTAAVGYALTLPGMGRPAADVQPSGALPQVPEIDLNFDLTGCEATWTPAGGGPGWKGWLPHLDLAVSRALTAGSAPHDALWAAMAQPGDLTLRTKLDLTNMLRPEVQPGSRLDEELPPEDVAVSVQSSVNMATMIRDAGPGYSSGQGQLATFAGAGWKREAPPLLEVTLKSPGGAVPALSVWFTTRDDSRRRPFPLRRFLQPWADPNAVSLRRETAAEPAPELKGGSWARGRQVFYGEPAACSKCHAVGGQGGEIGPDLSNLVHRDYASVLRDVTAPSFAINPDHLTYTVLLTDGRTLTGVVRTAGDTVRIGDLKGAVTEVPKVDVEKMIPSSVSTMPEGIPKLLGPERTRDLMTFLLAGPPRMPDYGKGKPPAPRTRKEVAAVLAGAPTPPASTRKVKVVLVAGRKDHGPGEHDYPAWKAAWGELFAAAANTAVETADPWPTAEQLKTADVLVFYQQGTWTPERAKEMDAFLARGGGAVYIHYAVDGGPDAPGFAKRIGLAWQGGRSKFRHGPLDLGFNTPLNHPIGRNFDKVHFHDESYWQLVGDRRRISLLAAGKEDGKDQPLFWTMEPGGGRVFVSIPGHFSWTFDDPLFRVLLLRGIAWAAREPVDRFNDLVTPGARMND